MATTVRPQELVGRFRVLRPLKVGQGVETWLGENAKDHRPVVVKLASATSVPLNVQLRLEHEATVLRNLNSPFLTPLLDVGRQGILFYFVLPFVDGVTLEERLRAGPLNLRETLRVGVCLLSALAEAHAQGVLHRDVKPANVILSGTGPLHATLIDFGFARSGRMDSSLRDQPVGTIRYVSPEQAGVLDVDVDERADLYSTGMLLYECAAGHPPFSGESLSEILRQQITEPVPELRGVGIAVPRVFDEILQRLLCKDPRDRYHSAVGVLADLTALEEAIDAGVAEPVIVVGSRDERFTLAEAAFVGRHRALAAVQMVAERLRVGNGCVLLVEAESGGGKTRLLDEVAFLVFHSSWVLRGQGVADEAPRPFQMLRGVVDGILRAARADPAVASRLRAEIGEAAAAVCAALPELSSLLEPNRQEMLGPEHLGPRRTIDALTVLLSALGSPARPAIVILDDCQWADEATLALLDHWQQHCARGSASHVLVIASFRTEEVPPQHLLNQMGGAERIVLDPLDAAEVHQLAESMAGALPAEAIETVYELSEGSPFMASAVLRGMVETGALVREPTGWRVEPEALVEVRSSRRAALVLARRLERLEPDVLRLLSVGAVMGKAFDLRLAAHLAEQSLERASAAITDVRRRHLLWSRANDGRCVFVHDKIREALLARMPVEVRKRLHHRAATAIEARDPERVFDIAYHYDAADDVERAFPFALAAAQRARVQHALELAEQQFRIAVRGCAPQPEHIRFRVADGFGDVLVLRGKYDEAAQQLLQALALAHDDVVRAEIQGKLGDLAFKRGDVDAACRALEEGLRLLRRSVPRRRLMLFLRCAWEVMLQVLHTLLPHVFVARRSPQVGERNLLAVRLYSHLAHAYWFGRGMIPCGWAHLRELNLAESYTPSPELGQAYSEHAPVATMIPWFRRGIAYAKRSLAIRTALGDIWGRGQSLHFYGVVLYAASRYAESIQKCREAIRLLERTGDRWEINTARWHVAFAQYRLGDLSDAVQTARHVHEDGIAIGDTQASGISLGVWSKASRGRVPEALVRAERQRMSGGVRDVHTGAEVAQAEAVMLLRNGEWASAADVLRQALEWVRERGLRQEYVAPILPWLMTALRTGVESVPPWGTARRAALLREAGVVSRPARRLARAYRNNLPHVLRETALLSAISGRPAAARRLFAESLAIADAQNARHEAAQTRLAWGKVGIEHGWAGAMRDVEEAQRKLAALESGLDIDSERRAFAEPPTIALADRFDQLLDKGRAIAAALSRDSIFALVREAAAALLRGERCEIEELRDTADGSQPAPRENRAGPATAMSRSILRRAIERGRPVVSADEPDLGSESAVLSGFRSILCVPILVRGRAVACLWVVHSQVGRLFGDEEERIAHFIATLAGAALENAEGFATIEAAVETREEFLAIASHELKTPLTPLKLSVEILRRGYSDLAGTDPLILKRIEIISRQTARLAALVENLLDVSRITAGRLALQLEDIDLGAIIDEVVSRFGEEARRAGCELEPFVERPVRGWWDPLRLEQVVSNLLSNAIRYGAGHPVEVSLRAADTTVWLSVRDHGIGIGPEEGVRIFERFERGSASPDRRGLGLGLYITRQIVHAHGGSVIVDSTPGHGATFTVTLPRPSDRAIPLAAESEIIARQS